MHGEDYVCLGFLFGEKSRVAYISDVSRFPADTEHGEYQFTVVDRIECITGIFVCVNSLCFTFAVISKDGGGQLDLLILDTLYRVRNITFLLLSEHYPLGYFQGSV